jgi:hypothetical protein
MSDPVRTLLPFRSWTTRAAPQPRWVQVIAKGADAHLGEQALSLRHRPPHLTFINDRPGEAHEHRTTTTADT